MDLSIIKDILEILAPAAVTIFGLWVKDYKPKKATKGLEHTTTRLIACKNILHEIRSELHADRVQLWDGSNGTTSLSGYHIQKLSMFAESNKDGLPEISHLFENIPSQKLQRNLLRLADSDGGYIISKEGEEMDDVAKLNQNYGINTAMMVRIESPKKGWVGMLVVGWTQDKIPSSYEIAFTKLKASQLGVIDRV